MAPDDAFRCTHPMTMTLPEGGPWYQASVVTTKCVACGEPLRVIDSRPAWLRLLAKILPRARGGTV